MLDFLVVEFGVSPADIHIIGHSLGAHIAGLAGEHMSGNISRITGLNNITYTIDDFQTDTGLTCYQLQGLTPLDPCSSRMVFIDWIPAMRTSSMSSTLASGTLATTHPSAMLTSILMEVDPCSLDADLI